MFDWTCPPDLAATSLKMLTSTLKIRTARISSMTAAPRMVVPSLESRKCNSLRTSTEIETEVAANVTPKKMACSFEKEKSFPNRKTRPTGTMTPQTATENAGFKYFLSSSKSLSSPAMNIKMITPISEKV